MALTSGAADESVQITQDHFGDLRVEELAILRPLRYTDLLRGIPGISQRMLTLTLRRLHRDGLITRTAYAEVPPRVEYALTP